MTQDIFGYDVPSKIHLTDNVNQTPKLAAVYKIAELMGKDQVFLEQPSTVECSPSVRIPGVKVKSDYFDLRGVGNDFEAAANDYLIKSKNKCLVSKNKEIFIY